jgi:hypothetical protein
MDDQDLEKIGKNLNIEEAFPARNEDMQSVITQDRLRKFNEI